MSHSVNASHDYNTGAATCKYYTLLRKACKFVVRRASTYAVRRDCKYDADAAQGLQILEYATYALHRHALQTCCRLDAD